MKPKPTPWAGPILALYALAVLALAVTLLAPATRRIAREHISYLLPVEAGAQSPMLRLVGDNNGFRLSARERAFAAAHPNDEGVQMSYAMRQPHPRDSTNGCIGYYRNLAPLMDRFPRSAVVRAAVVRYGSTLSFPQAKGEPGDWAAFDRASSEGERLEPRNAYFPTMTALGQHVRGRKAQATQALLRAESCSEWDDHFREQTEGMWRLNEFGDPRPDGLNRWAVAESALFPHYARLRGFAGETMKQALGLESSGHVRDGLKIRHALMRIGSLMRTQATILVGNFIGAAFVQEAAVTAAGSTGANSMPLDDRRDAARDEAYERYLVAMGQPAEAAFAHRQFEAGAAVYAIARSMESLPGSDPLRQFNAYILEWLTGLWLIACAAVMLLCGILTSVLARMGWADPQRRIPWTQRIAATAVVAAVVLVPVIWEAKRLVEPARWAEGMFNPNTDIGPMMPLVLIALLAVPILLKLVLILSAVVRRRPITGPVVSGFQHAAFPITAIMVLCYCGIMVNLARNDRTMADTVTNRVQHEGRYYAHLQGKQWPEQ